MINGARKSFPDKIFRFSETIDIYLSFYMGFCITQLVLSNY